MPNDDGSWKLSASKNYHIIRGDNVDDLKAQAASVGVPGDVVTAGFQDAWGLDASERAAIQNLQSAGLVDTPATVIGNGAGYGQPLQPPAVVQPPAQNQSDPNPPIATAPVNPATGRPFNKWVPPGTSKKTGRTYKGFWTDD